MLILNGFGRCFITVEYFINTHSHFMYCSFSICFHCLLWCNRNLYLKFTCRIRVIRQYTRYLPNLLICLADPNILLHMCLHTSQNCRGTVEFSLLLNANFCMDLCNWKVCRVLCKLLYEMVNISINQYNIFTCRIWMYFPEQAHNGMNSTYQPTTYYQSTPKGKVEKIFL